MERKAARKRKGIYIVKWFLVRMIQIGVLYIGLKIGDEIYRFRIGMYEHTPRGHVLGSVFFESSIPVWVAIGIVIFIDVFLYGAKQWMRTGMKSEELEQHVLSKTPPEVLKKAKTMEDDWNKLNEYLTSVQEEIGFSHDEMITLLALCHNMGKEYDRKRREEEDARAVKEIEAKLKREEEERARKEETEKYLKKYGLYKEEEKE